MIARRTVLLSGAAASLLAGGACQPKPQASAMNRKNFPNGFLWGAATSGHQTEGQNINSDLWYLEQLPDSAYKEPSGYAANSYELWETDLDIAKAIGLNSYRFSVEWARIEPREGEFSETALQHYRNILKGCKARGLKAFVTFNHFVSPLWFSADGGWTNAKAPVRFARYCSVVAKALASDMDLAITFNEPQILPLLRRLGLPDFVIKKQEAMILRAEAQLGVEKFSCINVSKFSDIKRMQPILVDGHIAAREAIKAVRPDLPLGVSIAIFDDQEAEPGSIREQVREELYAPWLQVARDDDFLGIQNYERMIWNKTGKQNPPADEVTSRNFMGHEIYAPSLAGAVRYGHKMTGRPIVITEHGVGTEDDTLRGAFIAQSLGHLHEAMADGVPVLGYFHWSLLDNFEWVFGFGPKFGLVSVDRSSFERIPKPSALAYGKIAKSNAVTLAKR